MRSKPPVIYQGPIGPFLEPPDPTSEFPKTEADLRLLITLALKKTHGIYQRYLVTGWESWDGVTIQGRGRLDGRWSKGFYKSKLNLEGRLLGCGIAVIRHYYNQPPDPRKADYRGRTNAYQKCVLARVSYLFCQSEFWEVMK